MREAAPLQAFGNGARRLDIAVEPGQGQFCTVCHVKARAAGGKLSCCLDCLRADVEKERQQREARKAKARQKAPSPRKTCRTCNATKPLACFGVHRRARDGHRKDCRVCAEAKRTKHPGRHPNLPKLDEESTWTNESA